MKVKAIGIIKNSDNITIGAKFRDLVEGKSIYENTQNILRAKHIIECTNANINKDGFIKTKFGHKLSIFYTLDSSKYITKTTRYKVPDDIDKRIHKIDVGDRYTNKIVNKLRVQCMEISRDTNFSAEVMLGINVKTLEYAFALGDYTHVSFRGFEKFERLMVNSEPHSLLLTHNHPTNSFFSSFDIDLFRHQGVVYAIEAIGNTGDSHMLIKRRIPGYQELDMIYDTLKLIHEGKQSHKELLDLMNKCQGVQYSYFEDSL